MFAIRDANNLQVQSQVVGYSIGLLAYLFDQFSTDRAHARNKKIDLFLAVGEKFLVESVNGLTYVARSDDG